MRQTLASAGDESMKRRRGQRVGPGAAAWGCSEWRYPRWDGTSISDGNGEYLYEYPIPVLNES